MWSMIITDISKLKIISDKVDNEVEAEKIIKELELALNLSKEKGRPGIGLSAIQIGINKRIAIVRIDDIKINLINSVITNTYNKLIYSEGCLSLPGASCEVERANQIIIKNEFSEYINFCAYGIVSVCIQHEMDHWDGILITDRQQKKEIIIGPNQPCPCGKIDSKTGKPKKYKKCCRRKNNG